MSILRFPKKRIDKERYVMALEEIRRKAVETIVNNAQVDRSTDPSLVRLAKRLDRNSSCGE